MKSIQLQSAWIKTILLFFSLLFGHYAISQHNVGINTPSPKASLDVTGSFMVSSSTRTAQGEPGAENIYTLVNGQTLYLENDSLLRFYDPGGPSGNYLPNLTTNVRCSTYFNNAVSHLEFIIESLQLGTGDTLKIMDEYGGLIYSFGNTSISSPVTLHSSNHNAQINFKSNADASTGQGFSLLVRYVYNMNTLDTTSYKTGYGIAFQSKDQSIRFGRFDQGSRGFRSIGIGSGAFARGNNALAAGEQTWAIGNSSVAIGSNARAEGGNAIALGAYSGADGNRAIGIGAGSYANGFDAVALGSATATGSNSLAAGFSSDADGTYSIALGLGVRANSYGSLVIGRYNQVYSAYSPTSWVDTEPLFVIGNGTSGTRANALTMRKDGRLGLGTDFPAADLHIRQSSDGGLILQNSADNNRWRIYSASGDNNLTFYNNSNTEIADIDDLTGTFNAISDARLKKNISPLKNMLSLVLKLKPSFYHFNWQNNDDEKQIGLIAQEAYQLFPELVSYDKTKDLYKVNYAGFSIIALQAIQEQQQEIEELKKRLERLEEKLK